MERWGKKLVVDDKNTRDVLKVEYNALEATLGDNIKSMIQMGHFPRRLLGCCTPI